MVFGISDETRTLRYDHGDGLPEVFLQTRCPNFCSYSDGKYVDDDDDDSDNSSAHIHTGILMIAKCPVVYPGDILLCYGVQRKEERLEAPHFCDSVSQSVSLY